MRPTNPKMKSALRAVVMTTMMTYNLKSYRDRQQFLVDDRRVALRRAHAPARGMKRRKVTGGAQGAFMTLSIWGLSDLCQVFEVLFFVL